MNLAWISLAALIAAITLSMVTSVNVGVVSLALAWIVGVYLGGMETAKVVGTFPVDLLINLVGITLLFGMANNNGTLGRIAARAVRACRGSAGVMPIMFFFIAVTLSSIGPGNIATTAIMAPMAMAVAIRAAIPPFLMALMVGNGANAGNLSPISAVGIIVQTLMRGVGLGGHEWSVWAANFTAHALAGLGAWLLFGGLALIRHGRVDLATNVTPLTPAQRITVAVTAAWILGVVVLKMHPGLSAFAAAGLLVLLGAALDGPVVRSVPWSVVVMVCGVSMLIGVLEKTGGMDLFTTLLAAMTTPATVNGAIAFVTGLISTYSSTSGVVYPAFLPAVPGIVQKLGGGDPLQVAMSINVGAAVVDVSPLSTIGALAIAAIPPGEDARALFRKMLAWGLSMTVAGAIFCQWLIWVFAR